jgi:hypothetical protein
MTDYIIQSYEKEKGILSEEYHDLNSLALIKEEELCLNSIDSASDEINPNLEVKVNLNKARYIDDKIPELFTVDIIKLKNYYVTAQDISKDIYRLRFKYFEDHLAKDLSINALYEPIRDRHIMASKNDYYILAFERYLPAYLVTPLGRLDIFHNRFHNKSSQTDALFRELDNIYGLKLIHTGNLYETEREFNNFEPRLYIMTRLNGLHSFSLPCSPWYINNKDYDEIWKRVKPNSRLIC